MVKPYTYKERRDVRDDDKYVFISYSHVDFEIVFEDLNSLFDAGLNYWYDHDLAAGKEWDTEVESVVRDDNCLGIIFFMTENLFLSKAVQKEINIYRELKETKKEFFFFCISPGCLKVNELIRRIYSRMPENTDPNSIFPLDRLECIITTFKDETIFIGREEGKKSTNHIKEVVWNLEKKKGLFANDESFLSSLVSKKILSNVNGIHYFNFGSYPQNISKDVSPVVLNGKFIINKKAYFAKNGVVFSYDSIAWRLVKLDGKYGIFVSDLCLDYMKGGQELIDWIEGAFREEAFTDEEKKILSSLSILSKTHLEQYKQYIGEVNGRSDYFNGKADEIHIIWLLDVIPDKLKRMCANSKGIIMSDGMPYNNMGGVRPVICVDFTSII